MQEKNSKKVFNVPFNDISNEVINTNPELFAFQKSGINGKIDGYRERFRDYWNNNVADTFANPPENHQEGKDKWIESTVEV